MRYLTSDYLEGPAYQPISDLPLGTAKWFEFPRGCRPRFDSKAGDLFLGRTLEGDALGVRDDRHVMVCAGTRADKGVSIIIPNLITWRGSCVVVDPKGENAVVTARRRGSGSKHAAGMAQRVYILDPMGEVKRPDDSFEDLRASFNPLDVLSVENPESIDNAARIADCLFDTESSKSDPFWEESARDLVKAVCLFVVSSDHFKAEDRNLITVRRLIMQGMVELRDMMAEDDDVSAYDVMFQAMRRNKAFEGEVAMAGERFARMAKHSPKMLDSISAVAATNMSFLASQQMRACLSHSSFSLDDLKTDPRGVSIFLCLPQRFMSTHFRFLRLMVTLILTQMERLEQKPASGQPVLMLLDEFAGLKRMSIIETSSAQIAGFGVKLMFIIQSIAQLKNTYQDNWETLIANCGVRMFFGNDDHLTREYVSKLIGECEVVRRTATLSQTHGTSQNKSTGASASLTDGSSSSDTRGISYGSNSMQFSVSHADSQSESMTLSVNENQSSGANQSTTQGESYSVFKRSLITPDEVGRIFGNREARRAIVLLSGLQPLQIERIRYFDVASLAGGFDPHPHHRLPKTRAQLEARDAEIARQIQLEKKYEQERKLALIRERNEREHLESERIMAERRLAFEEKQRRAWEQSCAIASHNSEVTFKAMLWVVGVLGVWLAIFILQ